MSGVGKSLPRGTVGDLAVAAVIGAVAVALVIGAAFGPVVAAFVKAFTTPLIGAVGGIPDVSAWAFAVNGSRVPIGAFINALLALLAFLVLAAVVYFCVVRPMSAFMDRLTGEESVGSTTRESPECLGPSGAAPSARPTSGHGSPRPTEPRHVGLEAPSSGPGVRLLADLGPEGADGGVGGVDAPIGLAP